VMLLFLLLAIRAHQARAYDRSALALAAAIATKTFPVLLLPFFVLAVPDGRRARARYALLAVGPVALLLAPYVIHDAAAVSRELLGYSGIADFGWIGVVRAAHYWSSGQLLRSRPQEWGMLVPIAKALFLAAYALLVAAGIRGRLRLGLGDTCAAVFLTFLVLYGSVSAQYLLWPLPFGARARSRAFLAYSLAATAALIGFYAFLAPGVLFADEIARPLGGLWSLGTAAVLVASAIWLASLLLRREPS